MWRSMLTKLGSWTGFKLWWSNTVLSRASTHPQILTVLWFFDALHVTMLKLCVVNLMVGPVHWAHMLWLFWCTLGTMTSGIKGSQTHLSEASFAVFFPCSTKFGYCKQWPNAAEPWQQGYELVHFVAVTIQLSLLLGWPRWNTDEAMMQVNLVPLAGNFAFGVGHYAGLVEPFKSSNHQPAILGAWVVNAHGHLPGTIQ